MNYRNPELRERLAAEYALGTLRGLARRRFERLLADDAELRRLVEGWELRLNTLAETAPAVAPPARLWQRIEQRLGPLPTMAPRAGLLARWWQSIEFWRGLGLAATAAAAALVLYIALAPEKRTYVAVLIDAKQTPILVAKFDPDTRRLSVQSLQPPAADPAHSHELWLVAGGNAPRSLGLLAGAETTVDLPPDQAAAVATAILAISLEPPGGSKTGSPTEVLFTGAVVPDPKL
ncbi:MAG TPA: anti-sigma factor [Methylomirabilota bacterium]|nr:anti-sigma factor [Methylomirabilota bacterium]